MVSSSSDGHASADRVASGSSSAVSAGGVLTAQFFSSYVEPSSVQLFDDDRTRQAETSDEARRRRMEKRRGKHPLDSSSDDLLRSTAQRVGSLMGGYLVLREHLTLGAPNFQNAHLYVSKNLKKFMDVSIT